VLGSKSTQNQQHVFHSLICIQVSTASRASLFSETIWIRAANEERLAVHLTVS